MVLIPLSTADQPAEPRRLAAPLVPAGGASPFKSMRAVIPPDPTLGEGAGERSLGLVASGVLPVEKRMKPLTR